MMIILFGHKARENTGPVWAVGCVNPLLGTRRVPSANGRPLLACAQELPPGRGASSSPWGKIQPANPPSRPVR